VDFWGRAGGDGAASVLRGPLNSLTGVRFAAALGVFLFHFGAAFSERIGAPKALTTLLQNGNMGVSFFFVLSGFILTYTYDGRLRTRAAVIQYFVGRFSRIYPVYALALLLALPVLFRPLGPHEAVKVLFMVQSWTFPSDTSSNAWISQAWTLSIEFFFYLIFPLALVAMEPLKLLTSVIAAGIACVVICTFGIAKYAPGADPLPLLPYGLAAPLPVMRVIEFLLGMFACRVFRQVPASLLIRFSGWKTSLTAAVIVAILATTTMPQVASLATVLFPLLIIQLAVGGSTLAAILASRPLVLLGGASYALYIIHGPVRAWIRQVVPAPLDAALNLPVAVAVAVAIYLAWEQPAQRWLRAWYQRVEARWLQVASGATR
jgi:peptidoglycan/LPS O-acetylase OafA/YrhL